MRTSFQRPVGPIQDLAHELLPQHAELVQNSQTCLCQPALQSLEPRMVRRQRATIAHGHAIRAMRRRRPRSQQERRTTCGRRQNATAIRCLSPAMLANDILHSLNERPHRARLARPRTSSENQAQGVKTGQKVLPAPDALPRARQNHVVRKLLPDVQAFTISSSRGAPHR